MEYFFTFEGIEGSGKTTQIELAHAFLSDRGYKVRVTREPGGTALGERIREILLSDKSLVLEPVTELLLYEASRAQVVSEVIRPALQEGSIVLCDRFTDATMAYQGYGRGLDLELIRVLNGIATGGLYPEATFLLDCPASVGLRRINERSALSHGRGLDRLEQEGIEFHERVRQGYLDLAEQAKERIVVLDARQDARAIHAQIKGYLLGKLEKPEGSGAF
jgi:dTMP kinase